MINLLKFLFNLLAVMFFLSPLLFLGPYLMLNGLVFAGLVMTVTMYGFFTICVVMNYETTIEGY